jgi:hypothetical protein
MCKVVVVHKGAVGRSRTWRHTSQDFFPTKETPTQSIVLISYPKVQYPTTEDNTCYIAESMDQSHPWHSSSPAAGAG